MKTKTYEDLVYKLEQEFYEEGQVIFKNGDELNKIYILADGSIDTYISLQEEDLILDSIQIQGSILGQYSVISQECVSYSARATQETNILVLSLDVINKVKVDNK